MGRLISLLIDRSHQRVLASMLWLVSFVVVLLFGAGLGLLQLVGTLRNETSRPLVAMQEARATLEATQALMAPSLTAEPCSAAFHAQMRQLAYLPDGINEFLYAPDGVVHCAVAVDIPPYSLGDADLVTNDNDIYLNRSLDFLGLVNATGTIMRRGDFAMVIPKFPDEVVSSSWLRQELVMVTGEQLMHRAGEPGLAAAALEAPQPFGLPLHFADGRFYYRLCDQDGLQCAVTSASVAAMLQEGWPTLLGSVAIAALLAVAIGGQLHALLRRFWSFDARFLRHFTPDNILCTYQPILSLETGTISGCEVLVRWRDVDGSVIFPDQFLPVVGRRGLSRQLTRMVVDRAFVELSARVPRHLKLQINFNICPVDLDAAWLREVLTGFEQLPDRFRIAVEIVESDELEIEAAQREIAALHRYGIRTQLDDFGTGYSNIQKLASLSLDGVKLDRSFAMAEDGALMHKMLSSTIEMIHAAGQRITVEGVETEERLREIAATGHVHFAQGYYIGRPLDIDRFVQVLGERSQAQRPRLVA